MQQNGRSGCVEPLSWWAGAAVWEEWVCEATELVGRCSRMGGVGVWSH